MDSKAICILGMHRSGTSLIARAVNLMGAYLGEEDDLKLPSPVNPEGFWERVDIKVLNEKILKHLKTSWQTPSPLPENWISLAERFRKNIQELVRGHFADKPLWAWKDPRTTIVFRLWKEALEELGVDVRVVFVVRNPLDVARSLSKRDGFSLDKGFGIWFNYNLCGLSSLKGVPTLFVSYDRFLTHWKEEIKRLDRLMELGVARNKRIHQGIKSAVHPELRHNHSTIDDLEDMGAPPQVIELYTTLADLCGEKGVNRNVASHPVVKRYMEEFTSYARFWREDMEEMLRLRDIGTRLKDIEHRLHNIEDGLDAMKTNMDGRLCALESGVEHIKTGFDTIEARPGTIIESSIRKPAETHRLQKGGARVSRKSGKK